MLVDIATGDLCDTIEVPSSGCEVTPCENEGRCLVIAESEFGGAGLSSVCLCSGQWTGDE